MIQEHIQQSIDNAVAGKSNLTQEILNIRGFSTPTIRHLFNNLCNIEGNYLEIGLYCGASFVSAFNDGCNCIGIENHFQDFGEGFELVAQELKDNINTFSGRAKDVKVHYDDCFTMDKSVLPKIDILYYDGFHGFDETAKSLPAFIDNLADKAIVLYDDVSWKQVWQGIDKALFDLKDKIEIEKCWSLRGYYPENDAVWWNGLNVYLINKK